MYPKTQSLQRINSPQRRNSLQRANSLQRENSPQRADRTHRKPFVARQRGSMLVIAIFILTVLLLLGVSMIQILSDSSRSIVYEVYGARALNAANSGAERAMAAIFPVTGSGDCDSTDAAGTLDLSAQTAFHGCLVTVTCDGFDITETGYSHFRIESTAKCNAGDFMTERTVAVEARRR